MPLRERHKRTVVQPGNATDPYERASHYDDWQSGAAREHLDLGSPVCATQVGGSGRQQCKLLSQRLCTGKSNVLNRTDESLGKCFARRRSCAVVGSSSHLMDALWGADIDSHDVVIRMNAAPAGSTDHQSLLYKFAPHVGTRTDVRFVNMFGLVPALGSEPPLCLFLTEPEVPEECGKLCSEHPGLCNVTCGETPNAYCAPREPEKRGVGRRRRTCDVSHMRCLASSMKDSRYDWGQHEVFADNLHGGIADQVVPHSTAGFKAVIYAMSICDHVSVIGFGPSCRGAVGSRYYEGLVGVADTHHYQEELGLLLRASENGTRAIIPPEARAWIAAKNVTVALPDCVKKEAVVLLHQVFQGFGASAAVRLASEGNFMAF